MLLDLKKNLFVQFCLLGVFSLFILFSPVPSLYKIFSITSLSSQSSLSSPSSLSYLWSPKRFQIFFFKLSNNVIFNNKISFYVRRSSIFPLHGFHYLEVAQSLSTCLELKDFLTKISMKPIKS